MTDTIIKGSGNSRTLVTVPNALALYPTHEELMTKWATEGIPVDIGQLEAIGCDVIGTLLNKANLLSDSVASNLGLSEPNRTPNQAFNTLRSLVSSAQSTANGRLRAESGSYAGSTTRTYGNSGTLASKTLSFSFSPRVVIIESKNPTSYVTASNEAATPLILLRNSDMATAMEIGGSGTLNRSCSLVWSGNSVTWKFNSDWTDTGHDTTGKTYVYIAIG